LAVKRFAFRLVGATPRRPRSGWSAMSRRRGRRSHTELNAPGYGMLRDSKARLAGNCSGRAKFGYGSAGCHCCIRGFRHVLATCIVRLTSGYVKRRSVSKPKLPLHTGFPGNCGGYRCPRVLHSPQTASPTAGRQRDLQPFAHRGGATCSSRWPETLDPEKDASRPEKGASRGMKRIETAAVAVARSSTLRRRRCRAAARRYRRY
jgi:hypothetical protein